MEEKNAMPRQGSAIISRLNKMAAQYADVLASPALYSAFGRAAMAMPNQPQVQNQRIKGISSLPINRTKEEIGKALRNPYGSERVLRETAEILRWTVYPFYKIVKTEQDIPTDRYYFAPRYVLGEEAKTKEFMREAILLDKLNKCIKPEQILHKIRGEALLQGKCFYATLYSVDKAHNSVGHAFLVALPTDWCTVIGRNNVSGWTVSFDMMYFMQAGASPAQYGDLFDPYLYGFSRMFEDGEGDYVYSSYRTTVNKGGREVKFYPKNVDPTSPGNPRVFQQNGTWAYYVSLPVDRVWAFEIDDTTAAVAPTLSGMMLTYAQQSDFEEIQKTLLTNPLVKIFTGEIPYFDDDGTRTEDTYKLSDGGRMLFEFLFANLMAKTNTAGCGFFTAPVENIKSHDFNESANANDISVTFNQYAGSKSGLAALIPVDRDIKAAQVETARQIESRYASACIYPQFERMMECIYDSLNLKYDWSFHIFGTIFNEDEIRKNAETALARGDTTALFTLCALDGQSWVDKVSMLKAIEATGIMDNFRIPETAYTQSPGKAASPDKGGRPKTEGLPSDAKEKAIDAGVTEE